MAQIVQIVFALLMAFFGLQMLRTLELRAMWDRGRQRLLQRPITGIGVIIIGSIVGGIVLLGLATKLLGLGPEPEMLENMPKEALAMGLAMNLVMQAGWTGICFIIPAVFRCGPFRTYGLDEIRMGHAFMLAIALVLVAFPFVILSALLNAGVMWVLEQTIGYEPGLQDAVLMATQANTPILMVLMALTAVIGAPISEEFTFRGVLLPWFCRTMGFWKGLIIVSLLFGMMHLHVPSILPLSVLGAFFAFGYILGRSLWVPIFMHFIFNGANILLMFLYPGIEDACIYPWPF